MAENDDRRTSLRLPLKVRIYISEGEGDGLLYFYSSNISLRGVFLISDLLLEAKTKLRLEWTLPLSDRKFQVKVNGEVRWIQSSTHSDTGFVPPGMGIKFIDIDEETDKALSQYIEENAPLD